MHDAPAARFLPSMNTLIDSETVCESTLAFLKVTGVHKYFGEKEVLAGVDFTIGSDEIVAIVGRSGCGKSTLLRLIAGLDRPTAGQIFVNGKPLAGMSPAARLMFQDASLLPWRTVLQNVTLAAPRHDPEIARQALTAVGLAYRDGEWPAILSGGQRQRVALARALAGGAPLLLLDEPLGALDALTRLEMQGLIERVWQEKQVSILLITHDAEEAIALADRVLVMEQGRFVLELEVPLSRSRNRSSQEFVRLKDQLLERVLNGVNGVK
jgi:sulfonate transport system ATP-binding protein